MLRRRRILFVAENLTLAQVVRLVVLASALPADEYDVHFACSEFPEFIFGNTSFARVPLETVDAAVAFERLERGRPIYDERTLSRYVEADLSVLARVSPDFVIGDLRWSLAVSAPTANVPYAALINAYWSPYAVRESFPVPDHPIVRMLGVRTAEKYFPMAMPAVFKSFAAPLNRLRRRHGLPEIGSLLEVLTFADHTLYADTRELVPTRELPETHRYLGPIFWSPAAGLPDDWGEDAARVPVYVTLGSSGALETLPIVLEALAGLAADVLVATAGRAVPALRRWPGVRVAEFVSGEAACDRARLVVTNGGSSTGYQALRAGVPVVGVAHNLDQYLAMTAIANAGAGKLLRADGLTAVACRAALADVLEGEPFATAARRVAEDFSRYDAPRAFRRFLTEVTG